MRILTTGEIHSFAQLIDKTMVYVDKTKPLCLMASQEDDILLTRPRRMGKSTLADTLEYLFSKGTVGTEGLYCHEHWPEPNRYFVFHFDWSDIFFQSKEEFEFAFRSSLNHYSKYFGITLATNVTISQCFRSFIDDCLAKLKDEAFFSCAS